MKTCAALGCTSSASGSGCGHGYCHRHWQRWRKYGDPLAGRVPDGEPLAFLRSQLTEESDECVDWPYGKSQGYGSICVDGMSRRAHEYVCELTHGPRPTDVMHAAHKCGNRACINPRHIRWRSAAENAAETVEHGRSTRGRLNRHCRLTVHEVLEIRRLATTTTQAELARRFGVSRGAVSDIVRRRNWAWLS